MTTILQIGHNNIGRPVPCPGLTNGYQGRSSVSPFQPDDPRTVQEFVRTLDRYGAAIVTDSRTIRSSNHHTIGVGVGHDDADWAESRFEEGSQAAWHENPKGERLDEIFPRQIAALRKRGAR